MPESVDLHSSGLWCSSHLAALYLSETIKTHSTLSIKQGFLKAACLALFSSFSAYGTTTVLVHAHQTVATTKPSLLATAVNRYHQVNTLYDGTVNCFSTLAQSSGASNETFTYKQALREPDYHDFIKAMVHKIHDHKKWDHWTCMQHSNMPEKTKTIMSIWSFKHKRFPDGTLNKHKAHLCAHGGMQTWGTNHWKTYAPVVNWANAPLLLAVAKIRGLPLKRIDFVFAFPQADVEVPVYMELPLGFVAPQIGNQKLYVLWLNKSLYGLNQAGYNWFAKLCNRLLDHGFMQSNIDACIFFGKVASFWHVLMIASLLGTQWITLKL